MAVTTVTVTEGANATVPGATSFPVLESSAGGIPITVPGYAPDSGTAPTPLADANGVKVQGTTTFSDMTVTTVNTPISVGDATSSTTLIAANADRIGWTVQNMSTADLYVRMGTSAALASCHRVLRQYESMGQKIMDGDLYLGEITGLWASDAGGTAVGGDWE